MSTKEESQHFYKLWLPILGAILTQFSFSITDSIMVAPFGEKYLGGIGIAGLYYTLTMVFFNGFLDIFSNLFARKLGISAHQELKPLYITMVMIILTSTGGSWAALSCSTTALTFFGQDPEILEVTSNHLNILSYGVLFSVSYYACVILLRVLGQAKTTFFIVVCGSMTNIIGNWILLYGPMADFIAPEMAVAWTTVAARVLMLTIIFFHIYQHKDISFPWSTIQNHLKQAFSHYLFILQKGTPVCARNLNDWLASVALVLIIGHFGTSCCAGNQATDMISSAMYMFIQASCTTIGILFSKWVGAHDIRNTVHRIEMGQQIKKMIALACLPGVIVLMVGVAFQDQFLSGFSLTKGTSARNIAEIILLIHFTTFPLYVIQHLANAFLDALFDTKIPSLFTFFVSYALVLPIAFVSVTFYGFPPYAVWIIDGVGMAIIAAFVLHRLFKVARVHEEKGFLEVSS